MLSKNEEKIVSVANGREESGSEREDREQKTTEEVE